MAKTTKLTDTAAQALAARGAGPRAVAPSAAPQGRKLAGNVGPGTLYPGAGKLVQRTGQPLRCGTIAGTASDFTEAPNTRDPARVSTRFVGEAIVVDYAGTVMRAAEWYLPPTATRGLKAQLKHGGTVMFAFEIWCEPDAEGRPPSPLGYAYVSYDRQPARDNDPLMALAYEAGILERPAQTAYASPEADAAEEIDPETGEIRPATPASQQAA